MKRQPTTRMQDRFVDHDLSARIDRHMLATLRERGVTVTPAGDPK